jgi:hypothetical protein
MSMIVGRRLDGIFLRLDLCFFQEMLDFSSTILKPYLYTASKTRLMTEKKELNLYGGLSGALVENQPSLCHVESR